MSGRVLVATAWLAGCTQEPERSTTTADPILPSSPDAPEPVDGDGDGFVAGVDCNDGDDTVYPGAVEVCGDDRITDCSGGEQVGHATVDRGQSFSDLNEALAAASPGSEVLVCGVFGGQFTAPVPVRLVGWTGDPSRSIDGEYGGTTLVVPSGTVLENLTIRNGRADVGGGVRLSDVGTLVLRATVVSDNGARLGGGIALPPGSTLILEGSTLQGNIADEGGGGVWVPAGATLSLDEGSLVDGTALYGGGVLLEDGILRGGTVRGNAGDEPIALASGVLGNTRPVGGGAVAVTGTSRIEGTVLDGSAGSGGGLSAFGADVVLLDVAASGQAVLHGGGLLALDSTVRFEGTSAVTGATASAGAGAALFGSTLHGGTFSGGSGYGSAAGLYLEHATVEGAVVRENTTSSSAVTVALEGTLVDVVIEDNDIDGIHAYPWSVVDLTAVPVGLEIVRGVVTRNGWGPGYAGIAAGLYARIPVVATETVFDANVATSGTAGLQVEVAVTLVGGSVTAHQCLDVSWPGAITLAGPDALLTIERVNFGTRQSENFGGDVFTLDPSGLGTLWNFDGLVSAVCTGNGCVAE